MSNIPDLQPIAAEAGKSLAVEVRGKAELRPPVTSAVWTSDGSTFYQLNAKCQDLITLYLGRSLMASTNPIVRQVNRSLLSLAFSVSRLQWLHCVCHRAGRDSANGAASTRF